MTSGYEHRLDDFFYDSMVRFKTYRLDYNMVYVCV